MNEQCRVAIFARSRGCSSLFQEDKVSRGEKCKFPEYSESLSVDFQEYLVAKVCLIWRSDSKEENPYLMVYWFIDVGRRGSRVCYLT